MATTLLQLRTRARQRADAVNSTFVTDSELTNLINLGLSELYDLVVSSFEDYFTISTTLTVASGNTVALPVTFYKLRGLDYNNNGSYQSVREFSFNERNSSSPSTLYWTRQYTVPRKYRIVGDNLLLQPESQSTGLYRLWYVPAPTFLVTDADVIPESLSKFGWDDYIVLWAAERMLSKEESPITDVVAERMQVAGRIAKMASDRQVDQSETVQDVRNEWNEY